jgi:hypothetical protein
MRALLLFLLPLAGEDARRADEGALDPFFSPSREKIPEAK